MKGTTILATPLPEDDEAYLAILLRQASGEVIDSLSPLPSFDIQRRFNAGSDPVENIRNGFAFYQDVLREAADLGLGLSERSLILDLGCGWGRIARMFLREVPQSGLFGVDVSVVGIETCRAAMPSARFELTDPPGPTPFESRTFDLVVACSVFSHLPEGLHLAWLSEIARLLRPGGVLVATVLPPQTITHAARFREDPGSLAPWQRDLALSLGQGADADVAAGRFVFGPHPRPDYGQAIIPEAYIRRVWSQYLDVRSYASGMFAQRLVVCTAR